MPKKIDFILPSLATGGAEKVMLLLAEQFNQAGYKVRFVIRRRSNDGFEAEVEKVYELVDLQAVKVRHFPAKLWSFYNKNNQPQAVIASLWPLTFLTAIIAKSRLPKTKILTVEHGSLKYQVQHKPYWYKAFLRTSLRTTLRMVHKMIAVSKGLQTELGLLSNYQGPKLISIPNPIEKTPSTEQGKIPDKLIKVLKDNIFLFVGRLKKVKNIPLLLNAFRQVRSNLSASLIIVGDGPERTSLENQCQDLGIEQDVHFVGFQSPVAAYYSIADVFVLPSDSEGFGNVLVEALMEGCTVVSTDCLYGPREILDQGIYGYLSPVGNVNALATNMLLAIDQPIDTDLAKARGNAYLPAAIFKQYESAIEF